MDIAGYKEVASTFLHCIILPRDATELSVYYLVWVSGFLIVNIIWDIKSPVTEEFHFLMISKKLSVAHHGATLCSSILMLVSIVSPHLWDLAKESYLPVIIAGFGGLLTSIVAACPYSMTERKAYQDKCRTASIAV